MVFSLTLSCLVGIINIEIKKGSNTNDKITNQIKLKQQGSTGYPR